MGEGGDISPTVPGTATAGGGGEWGGGRGAGRSSSAPAPHSYIRTAWPRRAQGKSSGGPPLPFSPSLLHCPLLTAAQPQPWGREPHLAQHSITPPGRRQLDEGQAPGQGLSGPHCSLGPAPQGSTGAVVGLGHPSVSLRPSNLAACMHLVFCAYVSTCLWFSLSFFLFPSSQHA